MSRLRSRLEITLLESRSEVEYREAIETAITEAEHVLNTFSALLSISRAEAGTSDNDPATVDLGALGTDLSEFYEGMAADLGIALELDIAPGVTVQGDRQLLAQALSNLLDNAIKYAGARGRTLISVQRAGQRPVLSVGDNGPGIPPGERDHVLHRFVRLDNARATPGNGLGLSLVKAVMEFHQARLSLEDNNPGLRVTLEFPSAVTPPHFPKGVCQRDGSPARATAGALTAVPESKCAGVVPVHSR